MTRPLPPQIAAVLPELLDMGPVTAEVTTDVHGLTTCQLTAGDDPPRAFLLDLAPEGVGDLISALYRVGVPAGRSLEIVTVDPTRRTQGVVLGSHTFAPNPTAVFLLHVPLYPSVPIEISRADAEVYVQRGGDIWTLIRERVIAEISRDPKAYIRSLTGTDAGPMIAYLDALAGDRCRFCRVALDPTSFCFGCSSFVCASCTTAAEPPSGTHAPEAHR